MCTYPAANMERPNNQAKIEKKKEKGESSSHCFTVYTRVKVVYGQKVSKKEHN